MKVISVRDVSKKFILAHDRPKNLADALRGIVKRGQKEDFWALADISFDVEKGEALGIIGHNGAGKSTMLKLLTRIMDPTMGTIRTRGRVSALIEVAAGFHPEMTGRENIYLNGSILGMTRKEIDRKLDEIVAFAQLEKFVDTPVKRYSSGMYARLGFAIAAHVEPDILIVDEVLAVGDAEFQKKCLGKMGEVRDNEGRTIVFVSHNMLAVQALCGRALLIDHGRIIDEGPPKDVTARYLGGVSDVRAEHIWDSAETAPGNDIVRFKRVCIKPETGSPDDPISISTPIVMEFEFWNMEPKAKLQLSVHVYNEEGVRLFITSPMKETNWHGKALPTGLFKSSCHIPSGLLNDGRHSIEVQVVRNSTTVVFGIHNLIAFDVIDEPQEGRAWWGKWEGAVRPDLHWTTELMQEE
jgi:lipopolysaccharide transport system ATP-binding protein